LIEFSSKWIVWSDRCGNIEKQSRKKSFSPKSKRSPSKKTKARPTSQWKICRCWAVNKLKLYIKLLVFKIKNLRSQTSKCTCFKQSITQLYVHCIFLNVFYSNKLSVDVQFLRFAKIYTEILEQKGKNKVRHFGKPESHFITHY
jgi:hypothetical protein